MQVPKGLKMVLFIVRSQAYASFTSQALLSSTSVQYGLAEPLISSSLSSEVKACFTLFIMNVLELYSVARRDFRGAETTTLQTYLIITIKCYLSV